MISKSPSFPEPFLKCSTKKEILHFLHFNPFLQMICELCIFTAAMKSSFVREEKVAAETDCREFKVV